MATLTHWECDKCGAPVTAADGYVVWDRIGDDDYSEFSIIHQSKCDDDTCNSSLPLADFLGADGAARLTSFLSLGPVILTHSSSGGDRLPKHSLTGWVDFFRRVQIPGYEEARKNLRDIRTAETLSDWNEVAPYTAVALQDIAAGVYTV